MTITRGWQDASAPYSLQAAKPDVVGEEEMPVQTAHGLGGTQEAGQT